MSLPIPGPSLHAPQIGAGALANGSRRGRGAGQNPPNRFDRFHTVVDPDLVDPETGSEEPGEARPRTLYMSDPARTAIAYNQSPDIGFNASVNPYRGCEHGCSYCYARPTHEYLGFSAGLDFETRILVKERAPELLRAELSARRWKPQAIGMSGVTDPYQPIERRMLITRRCLEVLAEFRNPVALVTKSALVARDRDLLVELAAHRAAAVHLSITTLDPELQRAMEPRASRPELRLRAIEHLSHAGIPVGVIVGPVIPGLNDHELPKILHESAKAGATFASYIVLRLPHGVKEIFADWLERHRPDRKKKVLHRIQSLRNGKLDDSRFGVRHRGEGVFSEQIRQLYELSLRRERLDRRGPPLSVEAFRRPGEPQLSLFG